MIRVLLADDHRVVRTGLEAVLRDADDIEVVGAAPDGRSAVAMANELRPDVVLMDLSMPQLDGVAATRQIVELSPDTNVVVLTSFSDRDRILDALDAGAVGYLLKDSEPADIIAGIQAAARGESPLDPRAARAVLSARTGRQPTEFTPRERDVLVLVAQGMANKQIARRLGISEKTVKAHLTSVFQRLGVTDRTQAALWAQRHGLV